MTTNSIMRRTTIINAHLRENTSQAQYLVDEGFPVLLFVKELTQGIKNLAKNPLVQLRFCRHDDLKGLFIV